MSRVAFIFPGQGAQKCGMGKDFYETNESARALFDQADNELDIELKKICFEENEDINNTAYTQAALVTTCLAMARVLTENGVKPDVTAGLSLGEYPAIVLAGGMSEIDAIKLTRKRGIYMDEAVPDGEGAMCAILGLDGEAVNRVTEKIDGAYVANYNCPGQVVITGRAESVEKAADALKEAGARKVVMLKVSGPFHSPLLKGAGDKLEEALTNVELGKLAIPYVTNVTAKYVENINDTKELLAKQVSSSVLWEQSVKNMLDDGVDTFVEIGPGKTLTGFIKKITKEVKMYNVNKWEDIETVVNELGKDQ